MASLRLTFPEKVEPTSIVLTGARITIGRLPLNTIQIIDRTLSGFHAELIEEDGHYRLHDRGSTNGTFVNGEAVTDYHLREASKVAFGTVECEFSLESPAAGKDVEALPTRSEMNALRQENTELKNRIEALGEELEGLRKVRATDSGEGTVSVSKEEFEKVTGEHEALKQEQFQQQQEIARLKTDFALLQRDRENLQRAADAAEEELDKLRGRPGFGAGAPAAEPAPPAPIKAKEETASEAAAPAFAPAAPVPTPPEPSAASAPQAPTAAPGAPAAPAAPSLPKPTVPLATPKPPGFLPVKPVGIPAAGARPGPAAAPGQPLPKPGAVLPISPGVKLMPAARPAVGGPPAPGGAPKAVPGATPSVPGAVGKSGTAKIDVGSGPTTAKPLSPTAKPPMKLPMQPTLNLKPKAASGAPEPDSSEPPAE
jgi:pSer/pThr/pTyr-binding forkhead associated (FHA) protein